MIAIDIASPETDIEDVQTLVQNAIPEKERQAAYDLFAYCFHQTDEVNEKSLKVLVNSELQSIFEKAPDTVEGMRSLVEEQRMANEPNSRLEQTPATCFLSILTYTFTGDEKSEAERAQKEAIRNDWEMGLNIPIDGLK